MAAGLQSFGGYLLVEKLPAGTLRDDDGGGGAELFRAIRREAWGERSFAIKRRACAGMRRGGRGVGELSSLSHVNLAEPIEWGESEGAAFVAVEWVDGPSLALLLSLGGPLPAFAAAFLVAEAARGISFLHARKRNGVGLLHLHLSPRKLLVGEKGLVKVVGLEHALDPRYATPSPADAIFRSPEERAREPLDPRSDVYALGAILRYALGAPPDARPRRGTPPLLDRIVARATAPDRSARHDSAGALRRDLLEYLQARDPVFDRASLATLTAGRMATTSTALARPTSTPIFDSGGDSSASVDPADSIRESTGAAAGVPTGDAAAASAPDSTARGSVASVLSPIASLSFEDRPDDGEPPPPRRDDAANARNGRAPGRSRQHATTGSSRVPPEPGAAENPTTQPPALESARTKAPDVQAPVAVASTEQASPASADRALVVPGSRAPAIPRPAPPPSSGSGRWLIAIVLVAGVVALPASGVFGTGAEVARDHPAYTAAAEPDEFTAKAPSSGTPPTGAAVPSGTGALVAAPHLGQSEGALDSPAEARTSALLAAADAAICLTPPDAAVVVFPSEMAERLDRLGARRDAELLVRRILDGGGLPLEVASALAARGADNLAGLTALAVLAHPERASLRLTLLDAQLALGRFRPPPSMAAPDARSPVDEVCDRAAASAALVRLSPESSTAQALSLRLAAAPPGATVAWQKLRLRALSAALRDDGIDVRLRVENPSAEAAPLPLQSLRLAVPTGIEDRAPELYDDAPPLAASAAREVFLHWAGASASMAAGVVLSLPGGTTLAVDLPFRR